MGKDGKISPRYPAGASEYKNNIGQAIQIVKFRAGMKKSFCMAGTRKKTYRAAKFVHLSYDLVKPGKYFT